MISSGKIAAERNAKVLRDGTSFSRTPGPNGRTFKLLRPRLVSGWVRGVFAGIVTAIAGVAALYTAIFMLPYSYLHAMATRGAGGRISFFTPVFFQAMHARVGVIASICAGFVGLLLLFRSQRSFQ